MLSKIYRGLKELADAGDEQSLRFCKDMTARIVHRAWSDVQLVPWDHEHDAFFILSPHGIILDVNAAVTRYTGRKRSELVGHSSLELVPMERKEQRRRMFASVVKLGIPLRFSCMTAWGMTENSLEPHMNGGVCEYVAVTMRQIVPEREPWRRWRTAQAHGATVIE